MRKRRALSRRLFDMDMQFEPWVYRFVFGALILAFLANVVRLFLALHIYSGELLPYSGAPIGIVALGVLSLILWRRPRTLRSILVVIYIALTVRIAIQLCLITLSQSSDLDMQYLWVTSLMNIDMSYAVALNNWVLVGSNHLNSSVVGQNLRMSLAKHSAVVSRSMAIESCSFCRAA